MNVVYVGVLLAVLFVYVAAKSKKLNSFLLIPLVFIGLNFIIEGLVYFVRYGEFFFRFKLLALNNKYAINFFLLRGDAAPQDFFKAMLKRAWLENPRSIFLRRFYLFLPLVALAQSATFFKSKQNLLLAFWFAGLCLVFIGFTSSFERYQPLNLRLSWYPFPLFMPAVILSAIFLMRLSKRYRYGWLLAYLAGSIIMCEHYHVYFGKQPLDELKAYLSTPPQQIIFTDHHTKLGIDLFDGYAYPLRTKRIVADDFDWNAVQKNQLVVLYHTHIKEQKLLGFYFPDFARLNSAQFKIVLNNESFTIYEKIL